MARFIVEGGTPLRGVITPSGNKNAALPLIAAALLTDEPVTLKNLPRIRDVRGMVEIAGELGARIEELGPHEIRITAGELGGQSIAPALAREIRTSLLFAGPLLARRGRAELGVPGGDVIGRRRNDTHFLALSALGAEIDTTQAGYALRTEGLHGASIFLDEASVTATENVLMAAVLAKGDTVIRNAASEPHVQELGRVLAAMGARVGGLGTNTLHVTGVDRLHGVEHRIASDHMEVGSFIGAAAMTHGQITIRDAVPQYLHMTRLVFRRLGVETEVRGGDLIVPQRERYVVEPDMGNRIPTVRSQPWPGFPADLTSIATALATQAEGTVLIHEWMFDGRLYWVDSLVGMGARVVLADPHRAVVVGPTQLYGSEVRSPDIRAGMALLAATLCAKGQSIINNVEQIDRGYEDLDVRLRALGANIERTA
ncbi:MAG: UDP-N-acetylglucosamine 1-carboxyvinyltransferase [Chloroflexi bacterium]|nr:UDP-N-acetylglucosamine 1-carboxyvinyltransferase [Chloroflexota bacterium]